MIPRMLLAAAVIWLATAAGAQETAGIGVADSPQRVRHAVPQAGDAVTTLRYFRIQKGSYAEFVQVSREGVWPFFEKIGARVVGMWQVIHPQGVDDADTASADYDEVWLITRYASISHWRATRDMAALGGNGDDYRAAIKALARRRELTIASDVRFLQGPDWHNPPQYLPPMD